MARLKKVAVNNKSISEIKSDLLVSGFFKGSSLSKGIKGMGDNMNVNVSNAISIDKFKGDKNKRVSVYSGGSVKRVLIQGLGDKNKLTSDNLRAVASNLSRYANEAKLKSIDIDGDSFNLSKAGYTQAFVEGLVLGSYEFLEYKSKVKNENSLTAISICGKVSKDDINKGFVLGHSVSLARDLGNHPPNIQTPTDLANTAKGIAKAKNMKATIIDVKDFEKMNFGSFYGVARGAKTPAKMIIVEYKGGNSKDQPFALVGKGLTFDSGGISIKPSPKMDEMKFDMCGSAVVLGVMKAVSELQPKMNIIFAVGATENMPDADAMRPGDIITAYNGKTIEVLNTDAEGRLVLADVLSYVADKYKPVGILDFATLTGAVLIALGDRASGIMSNSPEIVKEVQKASKNTGEKVWELPLWDEYSRDIKSKIADIKNLGNGRLAGTITAGAFLKEFVGDTPWCHFDIAGTAWGPKEPSYQPKSGATGVAVRLVYDLLENRLN